MFALLLVMILVGGSTAGATTLVDNVMLRPPVDADPHFAKAEGQVELYLWDFDNKTGFSENILVFGTQVRHLPSLRGGGSNFYTMWITFDDGDPVLVHTFNTTTAASPGGQTFFTGAVWEIMDDYLASDEVWIDVYVESDDGCPGWDCGFLVLSGYLDR